MDDPGVRVLLTSEVGGEGIDLQRASAIVNYDLPWNPMVVEQRIGRIDRIGQRSERINIVNLVVEDSIEERILQRLFEKIGVFKDSIGELDDIVGDEVRELTMLALSGTLSAQDLERRVREREDALERKMKEAHEVLRRVDGLLAADQALVDEIDAVTGERQLPQPEEVRLFLNHYLGKKFVGSQLPAAAAERVVKVELQPALAQELERRGLALGPEAAALARRISGGPIDLTLSRDAAYRHSAAELVHLRHPLVTLAVKDMEEVASDVAVFSLELAGSKRLRQSRTYSWCRSSRSRDSAPRSGSARRSTTSNRASSWSTPTRRPPFSSRSRIERRRRHRCRYRRHHSTLRARASVTVSMSSCRHGRSAKSAWTSSGASSSTPRGSRTSSSSCTGRIIASRR